MKKLKKSKNYCKWLKREKVKLYYNFLLTDKVNSLEVDNTFVEEDIETIRTWGIKRNFKFYKTSHDENWFEINLYIERTCKILFKHNWFLEILLNPKLIESQNEYEFDVNNLQEADLSGLSAFLNVYRTEFDEKNLELVEKHINVSKTKELLKSKYLDKEFNDFFHFTIDYRFHQLYGEEYRQFYDEVIEFVYQIYQNVVLLKSKMEFKINNL